MCPRGIGREALWGGTVGEGTLGAVRKPLRSRGAQLVGRLPGSPEPPRCGRAWYPLEAGSNGQSCGGAVPVASAAGEACALGAAKPRVAGCESANGPPSPRGQRHASVSAALPPIHSPRRPTVPRPGGGREASLDMPRHDCHGRLEAAMLKLKRCRQLLRICQSFEGRRQPAISLPPRPLPLPHPRCAAGGPRERSERGTRGRAHRGVRLQRARGR